MYRDEGMMPTAGTGIGLRVEKAGKRRELELRALAREGLPIVFESRWKTNIGALCIWPHSGRWWNKVTGRRGKINSTSMRVLIETTLVT